MRVLPKDQGLAFPRTVKKRRAKRPKGEEAILQRQVDQYLDLKGIHFHRLPDSLMRWVFANPSIPIWIKKEVSDHVKGWADNVLFKPVSDKYCLVLNLELKSKAGKQSHAQKLEAMAVPVTVCNNFEDAQKEIEEFEKIKCVIVKKKS